MGACNFETMGYGKTPDEAYGQADREARYDRGNEGYTGTIAEKGGFVLFDLKRQGLTYARFQKMYAAYEDWQYKYGFELEEQARFAGQQVEGWKTADKKPRGAQDYTVTQVIKGGKVVRSEYKWYSDKPKPVKRIPKCPADAKYLPFIKRVFQQADGDKWGPAACVELDGQDLAKAKEQMGIKGRRGLMVFCFWGMASC